MTPLSQLRAKIIHRGKFRRGALSRASEHFGVSRETVRNWFFVTAHGIKWKPGKVTLARIEDALRNEASFEARKSGPKGSRR